MPGGWQMHCEALISVADPVSHITHCRTSVLHRRIVLHAFRYLNTTYVCWCDGPAAL